MLINKSLWEFAKGSRCKIALVSLMDFMIASSDTIIAIMLVKMLFLFIDSRFLNNDWKLLCVGILLLIVFRFVISKIRTMESVKASELIKKNIRLRLMQKIFDLGPAYTIRKRTGDLVSVAWSRVEWLNHYYSKYVPAAVSSILNTCVICELVISFDWVTGTACSIAAMGVIVIPYIFYMFMREGGEKEWEETVKYYSDCLDGIQGVQILKAFNANKMQCDKIHERGEQLRKSCMKHLKEIMLENGVLDLCVHIGSGITYVVVAVRYKQGYLDKAQAICIVFLIEVCFRYLLNMITAWHMGCKGMIGSKGIKQVFAENEIFENRKEDSQEIEKSDIVFSNVSFSYSQQDGEVLHDINLEIPMGKSCALVGSSGSGKSTMAHLLAGFYRCDRGTIRVGGMTLNEQSIDKVQKNIAAVWQDSYLFFGTCADNIRLGKPGATMDEVIDAAKKAKIHDCIMGLENGYDTFIGERGVRLSGGEKQRIAIARAFLKEAAIVIFDEATSALDGENEEEIQMCFENLAKEKTVLVIAHRLETIKNADQICVMKKGKIEARGTHNELLKTSREYAMLMGL